MARNTTKIWVNVNTTDVEWVKSQYPGVSLTALMTMLLTEFRAVSELTALDYAKLAAESLQIKLSGEVSADN